MMMLYNALNALHRAQKRHWAECCKEQNNSQHRAQHTKQHKSLPAMYPSLVQWCRHGLMRSDEPPHRQHNSETSQDFAPLQNHLGPSKCDGKRTYLG